MEKLRNFPWEDYLAAAAINDIDGLGVTQLDHMRVLDDIITDTSMDDWKTFLA